MRLFGTQCPYCDSRDIEVNAEKRGAVLREYTAYMLMVFVGTGTLKQYMRCKSCGGTFTSWQKKTFPDHPGYYFADPAHRPVADDEEQAREDPPDA